MSKGTERMKERIKAYLDDFAEKDEGFFFDYQNPDKNIDECVDFICTQVQKMNVEGLDDDDVYGLAIHYYQEENPGDIKKGLTGRVVVNHMVELTEEEKERAKEQAIKDLIEAEKKKKLEKEKREKEQAKERAEAERKKLAEEGVLSLF